MTTPHEPGPTGPPPPTHQPYGAPPPPGAGYPPPAPAPRTNPWVWAAIGTLALGLLGSFVLMAGWFLSGGWMGMGMDMDDFDDDFYRMEGESYYTDQPSVDRAMESPCEDLADAAAGVRPFAAPADARRQLLGLAEATAAMSSAIDAEDPDTDARMLSSDWQLLSRSLTTYADELGDDPSATFTMPEVDGYPVSDRILEGNDVCYVPSIVMVLDPELADSSEMGPFAY